MMKALVVGLAALALAACSSRPNDIMGAGASRTIVNGSNRPVLLRLPAYMIVKVYNYCDPRVRSYLVRWPPPLLSARPSPNPSYHYSARVNARIQHFCAERNLLK